MSHLFSSRGGWTARRADRSCHMCSKTEFRAGNVIIALFS